MDIRDDNLSLIESINQRRGDMLSLAGMVGYGTLSAEVAALLIFVSSRNCSFLSCAQKGGAGKTALMGALLQHLDEGIVIMPYSGLIRPSRGVCVMAQEISQAHYPGYVSGQDAEKFLSLRSKSKNVSVCSTAHADSPEELFGMLNNSHGIDRNTVTGIDVLIFIDFFCGKRKLSSLYQSSESGFDLIFKYNPAADGWEAEKNFDFSRFSIGVYESLQILKINCDLLRVLADAKAYDMRSADRLMRKI